MKKLAIPITLLALFGGVWLGVVAQDAPKPAAAAAAPKLCAAARSSAPKPRPAAIECTR